MNFIFGFKIYDEVLSVFSKVFINYSIKTWEVNFKIEIDGKI